MDLRSRSVRLALCALLIGTAPALALAPHDKAVGVHAAQLGDDQAGKSQSAQPQSDPAQDKRIAAPAIDDTKYTRERQEDRNDKLRSDTIAGIVGLITLFVLSIQTYFFRRQAISLEATILTMKRLGRRQSKDMQKSIAAAQAGADAAKRSADVAYETLIASNRAWIKAGAPIPHGDLSVNGAGDIFSGWRIPIQNIGKEIATDVEIKTWIDFFTNTGVDLTRVHAVFAICRNKKVDRNLVIFPNDGFGSKEIEGGHLANGSGSIAKASLTNTYNQTTLRPMLFGCVSYSSPSSGAKRHQTRFGYEILCSGKIFSESVTIHEMDLRLRPHPYDSIFSAD